MLLCYAAGAGMAQGATDAGSMVPSDFLRSFGLEPLTAAPSTAPAISINRTYSIYGLVFAPRTITAALPNNTVLDGAPSNDAALDFSSFASRYSALSVPAGERGRLRLCFDFA